MDIFKTKEQFQASEISPSPIKNTRVYSERTFVEFMHINEGNIIPILFDNHYATSATDHHVLFFVNITSVITSFVKHHGKKTNYSQLVQIFSHLLKVT